MIDRGDLPSIRFGSRRVRIRRSDLDDFIEASTKNARPSERRRAFEAASHQLAARLRRGPADEAAAALTELSAAALALAEENQSEES